ncbi:hypothetical protein HGQ17_00215 [Nesterenkonia sp. MY13]|uniref:Uncharacterized protein n=1 Tax=Nesterenkonia sedimenti TaxID=1463632 RepID=A0A7X8YCH8_9MICC|nr:hypothetical protein [Nesterenkonia sedimenti]NLS08455.1 hypothetical protein [Nesterenkonia sedimenti]
MRKTAGTDTIAAISTGQASQVSQRSSISLVRPSDAFPAAVSASPRAAEDARSTGGC